MKRRLFLGTTAAVTAMAAPPPPATPADRALLRVPYWSEAADAAATPVVQAMLNGANVTVARLLGPADDLVLLLVLDLAGDLSRVDPARDAINARLKQLPANTMVGLLRAQDGLRVLEDPTANRESVAGRIQELSVSGRAGLLDTMETALGVGDAMLTKARVRVAVLYVSDSVVTNYREDFANPVVNSSDSRDMSRRFPEALIKERMQQIVTRVGRTQTPLFIVQLNYENDRLNEAYQTGLIEAATSTGGNAEFCRTLAEIPDAVGRAFDHVLAHSSAELEFKPAGKVWQYDVQLRAKGAALRHRTRFLPKGKEGR
ncbi:MAG: hypothetical protein FJW31_22305 [Acidobacteria bacterium]|nr:hypothetical protein [Acidobacteriota bacterium]